MHEQLRDGDRQKKQRHRDSVKERHRDRMRDRERGGGKEQAHWKGRQVCRREQGTVPRGSVKGPREEPMSGMGWRHLTSHSPNAVVHQDPARCQAESSPQATSEATTQSCPYYCCHGCLRLSGPKVMM